MIYLDNAATSFPKPASVLVEVGRCLKSYCGNPGRSSHKIAVAASEKIYESRENIASLLHFDKPENIVFCQNATYGLNLVIKGLVNHKCHVIISDLEHNSVLRPLYKQAKLHDCEISIFNTDIPPKEGIIPLIKPSTEVIITTLASNVTGKVIDRAKISEIASSHGIKLVYDASQLLGHADFDIKSSKCDYLIAPGHKSLFGLQGSGFVMFGDDAPLETLVEGGNGFDSLNIEMPTILPERYEAGTLNTPAIVGLSEGIKFLQSIGVGAVEEKLDKLTNRCVECLHSFKEIKIYGFGCGIISFNANGIPSSVVSEILSDHNIATRSGIHCSRLAHKKLGTENGGAVRVSFSYFNSEKDVDKLYKSLRHVFSQY